MKILKTYKLRGIGFDPFEIKIDRFHGYYIRLLTFSTTYKKSGYIIQRASENSFFYIGIHHRENGGLLFVMRLLFGFLIRFYINPQKFIGCKECKTKVEKDEWNEERFWCPGCKKFIGIDETETVTSKKI